GLVNLKHCLNLFTYFLDIILIPGHRMEFSDGSLAFGIELLECSIKILSIKFILIPCKECINQRRMDFIFLGEFVHYIGAIDEAFHILKAFYWHEKIPSKTICLLLYKE